MEFDVLHFPVGESRRQVEHVVDEMVTLAEHLTLEALHPGLLMGVLK